MIDPATILDGNTGELDPGYRAAIIAALPDNVCPTGEFWRELAAIVGGYFNMTQRRQRRPPKRELIRWRKIAALTDELGHELRKIRRETPLSIDPLRSTRALSALWPVKDLAEAHVAGYQTINEASRGRNNPHRKFLYGGVLDLWRGLGQGLQYARSSNGTPHGPLIRFFAAVVEPVLGDEAPGAHGIAEIIDRERARAEYCTFNRRK
jgi:hypothetical protein